MAFDWKETLAKIAPTAATLLGGPFAGLAVTAIGDALGLPDASVKTIQDTLANGQMTGDQILALKKAELDLNQHLEDNKLQELVIAANDRDSARKREIGTGDKMPATLAILVLLLTAFGEGSLLMGFEPHIAPELVGRILGTLDAAVVLVLNYYFGSTAGSQRKTEIMAAK